MLFIQSCVNGHLGGFHFLAIVKHLFKSLFSILLSMLT